MAIVDKPTDYFNAKLYTGNGSTNAITGVEFQPDWVWLKQRSGSASSHKVYDSVRGTTKYLATNNTGAEGTESGVTAFGSDGFTVGSSAGTNANSETYVSWNWKAGTSFTNDASGTGIGSIDSTGSVNTDAGFSIITYSGTDGTETVAHGLSAVPKMIIFKYRNGVINWLAYHASLGATKSIYFDATSAATTTYDYFADTEPTSSVFTVKKDGSYVETNNSGGNFVAYCFSEVKGYSKFGSYTGNGNADGTFVYTGFKPAFVLVKRTNGTENWTIMDTTRDPFNVAVNKLHPNTSGGTDAGATIDILSNGFKNRTTNAGANGSGDSYIYLAIAENPFVTSTANGSIPATAR